MKNEICKYLFFPLLLLGCNHAATNAGGQTGTNKPIKNAEQCFVAINQKDTATLKITTMPNGKIQGHLVISYGELEPLATKKEFYQGEISGQFTKDTLFADYKFTNGTGKTVYLNPLALLNRSGKLILGYGPYENYLGRTWLFNHKAISFSKSRFQFEPADCSKLPQLRTSH